MDLKIENGKQNTENGELNVENGKRKINIIRGYGKGGIKPPSHESKLFSSIYKSFITNFYLQDFFIFNMYFLYFIFDI